MTETDETFVATVKGGAGYDAPWLVVRGATASELAENLSALADESLYQTVADAAALFKGAVTVTNGTQRAAAPAPTKPAGSGEPAQETQAEAPAPARQRGGNSGYGRRKAAGGGGRKPKLTYEEASADCVHGERVRRTGNGARGEWVGYFCPTPKGSADQCQPNFIDPADDEE